MKSRNEATEMVVDSATSAAFVRKFVQVLKQAGFTEVSTLSSPRDPCMHWHQFRRGPHTLSMATFEEPGEREKITLYSETVNFEGFIASAATETATEVLTTFLAPLSMLPKMESERTISRCLRAMVDYEIVGEIV